jgi:hypothetical protein
VSVDANRKTCGHTFYGKTCSDCRVAQLTAELAEARKIAAEVSDLGAEKDRSYYRVCKERDAAKAELAEAREQRSDVDAAYKSAMRALRKQAAKHQRRQTEKARERDAARAELQRQREAFDMLHANATKQAEELIEALRSADAAIAREQAAQSEAAAMREAILGEVLGDAHPEDWPACVRAVAGTAGRDLLEELERLRAEAKK